MPLLRVIKPMEYRGKKYRPGDVVEVRRREQLAITDWMKTAVAAGDGVDDFLAERAEARNEKKQIDADRAGVSSPRKYKRRDMTPEGT